MTTRTAHQANDDALRLLHLVDTRRRRLGDGLPRAVLVENRRHVRA